MSNKLILKKSSVQGKVPLTSDLEYGELALNYTDGKLYFKSATNQILSFRTNGENSVTLGTDTVGDYVATASTSGKGISGSATGEGSNFVITSNATELNTPSTIVFRDEFGNFASNNIAVNNLTVNNDLVLNQGRTLFTGPIIIENVFLIDTTSSSSTIQVPYTVDAFDVSEYRTAKYLVQITRGMEYHSTEVLIVHNDTSAFITEYGTVYTDVELGTLDAAIDSGEVRLLFTPNFTNTAVRVIRHTIKVS